jgi:RimJ/RimL family protein N-acetyltransferase
MGFGPRFEIPYRIDNQDVTVVMRPAQDGDAVEMARLLGDFTVQQFVYIQGGMTPKDEEEFFEKVRTSRDQILWVVGVQHADETETVVGITSLLKQRGNRYSSYIILANRALWGKGIAKLTHHFRTWYAFCELGAFAINSSYFDSNGHSGKALNGVGYVELGRNWRSHLTEGRWCDEVLVCCYNPLTISVLWPQGDAPELVKEALPKTEAAFARVREVLDLR